MNIREVALVLLTFLVGAVGVGGCAGVQPGSSRA